MHYRDLIGLHRARAGGAGCAAHGPLAAALDGAASPARCKHVPITPEVHIRPDEKGAITT